MKKATVINHSQMNKKKTTQKNQKQEQELNMYLVLSK